MSKLSDIEFAVMDEVYFPASFETVVAHTGKNTKLLRDTLIGLLKKQFVQQMKFNAVANDYEKCLVADMVNIEQYCYVATRQGLLEHNS